MEKKWLYINKLNETRKTFCSHFQTPRREWKISSTVCVKKHLAQNQGVKKHAKTLFWMFDISNQPKLKLIRSTK